MDADVSRHWNSRSHSVYRVHRRGLQLGPYPPAALAEGPGEHATRKLHWSVSRSHPNNVGTTAHPKYLLGRSLSKP